MRNIIRIIGVSLASIAGMLLVSGVAWAQALKTPIEGTFTNCRLLGEPEREWVDEDGIHHVRGRRGACDHVGDARGRFPIQGERFLASWDDDIAGETWFEHGTVSFSGRILGQPVSATGHYTLECTGPFRMQTCTIEEVWHLEDGRLLKWSGTWVEPDSFTVSYTGILLDRPGNRGGGRRR